MNNLYQKDKDIVLIRRTSGNKEFGEYPLIVQPATLLAVDPSNDIVCYPICELLASATSASWALTSSFTSLAGTTLYAPSAGTASWAKTAITSLNSSSSLISSMSLLSITASNANTASVAFTASYGIQFVTAQLTASLFTASIAIINQLTASSLLIDNLSVQSASLATTASYIRGQNVDGAVATASISNGIPRILSTIGSPFNVIGHVNNNTTIFESTVMVDNGGNVYGKLIGTASVATTASNSVSASYAFTASYVASASYYPAQQIFPSGSWASASISSSYSKTAGTSSLALTASVWSAYVIPTTVTSSLTASYVVQAISSSYAATASVANVAVGLIHYPTLAPEGVCVIGHIDGDGTIYESSVMVDSNGFIYGNLTGSAQTAQMATTASYAQLADSASYYPPSILSVSASYASASNSASYALSSSYSPIQIPDITNTFNNHYIGINQLSPQYTLDLGNNPSIGASNGVLTLTTQNDNNRLGHGIVITADNLNGNFGADGGHITLNAGNGFLNANGGDIILTPGVSQNANPGGVGINQSNPQSALDVVGSINFTGALLQNGVLYTASLAYTASHTLTVDTASYVTTASYVAYADNAFSSVSSSYSPVADFATTANVAENIPQIVPDSLGNGGTCLILNAADTGTTMYLHISASGDMQVTTWA